MPSSASAMPPLGLANGGFGLAPASSSGFRSREYASSANSETLSTKADELAQRLLPLRQLIVNIPEIPEQFKSLTKKLEEDQVLPVAIQAAAIFLRGDSEPFTPEERAKLMGVAAGANAPFDMVYVLQVLSSPDKLPDGAGQYMSMFESAAFDALGA